MQQHICRLLSRNIHTNARTHCHTARAEFFLVHFISSQLAHSQIDKCGIGNRKKWMLSFHFDSRTTLENVVRCCRHKKMQIKPHSHSAQFYFTRIQTRGEIVAFTHTHTVVACRSFRRRFIFPIFFITLVTLMRQTHFNGFSTIHSQCASVCVCMNVWKRHEVKERRKKPSGKFLFKMKRENVKFYNVPCIRNHKT